MPGLACGGRTDRAAPQRRGGSPPVLAAAILIWLSAAVSAPAQIQLPAPRAIDAALNEKLNRRGDLVLENTPMAETLLRVGELWGVNLVFSKELDGRVTGSFKQAPLREILDAVLLSNGYGYRPVGESLVIVPMAELGDVNPMFASAAVRLVHCEPGKVVESLRVLTSPQGKIHALDSAGVLMVVDFPDRVEAIRSLAQEMDAAAGSAVRFGQPLQIDVAQFAPQFASATALKDPIQAVLSLTGKVAVLPTENRVVVADSPYHLNLAARVIRELDIPRPQVRITALIYDLSLQDLERLGVNWTHAVKGRYDDAGNAQSLFSGATILEVAPLPGTPNGALTLMNLSRHIDLTAVIQCLSQAQTSRLLADPTVTVMDHESATIAIVTEIPYQQLTQTQQGGSIGTTAFREAGVKLEVVPHIADDGTIQMMVTPSFSRLTGFTPGEQAQPIIDRREARTTVRVANGQTLVIGGLRQREEIIENGGIPYLKDIKYIGALFRNSDTTVRESELVVFLRPEIVNCFSCPLPRECAAEQYSGHMLDAIPPAPMIHVPIPRLPPPGAEFIPPPAEPSQFEVTRPISPRAPTAPEDSQEWVPPPAPRASLPILEAPPRQASHGPVAPLQTVEGPVLLAPAESAPAREPVSRILFAPPDPPPVDNSVSPPGEGEEGPIVTPVDRSVWERIITGPEPTSSPAEAAAREARRSRTGR
jgi:general secretion pathway protein D